MASDVDSGLCDELRDGITGMETGALRFDDPMPVQMHLHRRRGGPGVSHELEMLDRPAIEASPLFQELFSPFGIRYAISLSVFLPKGEAMICVGFESPDADGYGRDVLKRMELLVPAFESASGSTSGSLGRAHSLPGSWIGSRPRLPFWGPTQRSTATEPSVACSRPSRSPPPCSRPSGPTPTDRRPTAVGGAVAGKPLRLAGGVYHLRLGRAPASVGPGWLVLVDRESPYPTAAALQDRLGLTARETEVALLIARGHSNQEVADALTISPHTARHHVQSVLDKLGISSRSAVSHVLLRCDPARDSRRPTTRST